MIAIMTPASFLIAFYLGYFAEQHFSTWIAYIFAGAQQTILLILCIIFTIYEKIFKKNISKDEKTFEMEEDSLIK
jgi:hypothetical protein